VNRRSLCGLSVWVVAFALLSFAQNPQKDHSSDSYIFASPNTRSALTDEDAQRSLTSFEQVNAVAVADRIGCSLAHEVEISNALGIYDDSAENSFILETDLKKDQAEYAAALLGRYAHQEFILVFIPLAQGPDRLWLIQTSEPLKTILDDSRQLHLTPLSVAPGNEHSGVWFVDNANKHSEAVQTLAARLKGTVTSKNGSAEFLGNDDRMKAATLFQNRINAFEKQHHQRLSAHLWRQDWRDAAARTCSTEPKP
jgi:hypothetical protein